MKRPLHGGKVRKWAKPVIVQILIITLFVGLLVESIPVALEDTVQKTVYVDKTDYRRAFREHRFYIYADSVKYTFTNTGNGYSNSALYNTISAGDQLSVVYYVDRGLHGNANYVIAAKTETEVYRSLDGYYEDHRGMPTVVTVIFIVTEMLYFGILGMGIYYHKKKKTKRRSKKLPQNQT